jgi:hypothetical protein
MPGCLSGSEGAGRKRTPAVEQRAAFYPMATQLLNAGCRVTSIQKFLGHKRLNSTMVYARVHDQTAAEDYHAAMDRVEQRLQIAPSAAEADDSKDGKPLDDHERGQLLDLIDQLADPDLNPEERIDLVERIRQVLNHNGLPEKEEPTEQENGSRPRGPPLPSPAFPWVSTI